MGDSGNQELFTDYSILERCAHIFERVRFCELRDNGFGLSINEKDESRFAAMFAYVFES